MLSNEPHVLMKSSIALQIPWRRVSDRLDPYRQLHQVCLESYFRHSDSFYFHCKSNPHAMRATSTTTPISLRTKFDRVLASLR